MSGTPLTHHATVVALLAQAAEAHHTLLSRLPGDIARSLPVDAQGIQHAIDHLADAAGFTPEQRRSLIRSHAVNPAVLHARVFGPAGLSDSTVIGAFVEGARVRADALTTLADAVGGETLGARVRGLLAQFPPPGENDPDPGAALEATYGAQERAALAIAGGLDDAHR